MMSTFVMSDIHGCYDELMKMLDKIEFKPSDSLIIAGDYVDRGEQSIELLDWICSASENVILLKGNHDVEFAEYVKLLDRLKKQVEYEVDDSSPEDTKKLYKDTRFTAKISWQMYDYYGTLREMINEKGVSLSRLKKWSDFLKNLPVIYEVNVNDKHFVIVHAGYVERDKLFEHPTVEDFYIYARDEAYMGGGKKDSIIIAGHTPTISSGHVTYTGGRIYKSYNEKKNCTFYDIDCGIVFRKTHNKGNLACLKLEDESEYYLY